MLKVPTGPQYQHFFSVRQVTGTSSSPSVTTNSIDGCVDWISVNIRVSDAMSGLSTDRRQLPATSNPLVSRQIPTHTHPSSGKTTLMGAGCTGHDDTNSRPLGDPRCADWTTSDGAKGCGDVRSWILIFWDQSDPESESL